jgi:hypothetical protein
MRELWVLSQDGTVQPGRQFEFSLAAKLPAGTKRIGPGRR